MSLRARITIAEQRRALRNREAREDWQTCLGDVYESGLRDEQERVENFGRGVAWSILLIVITLIGIAVGLLFWG